MKRPIRTDYYNGQEVIHTNCASYPDSAVMRAVGHMQRFDYKSTHCEVYDAEGGKLWAVLKMTTKRLEVLYSRSVAVKHTEKGE